MIKIMEVGCMAKEKVDLRKELRSYKFEFNLLQKIPCSKQENRNYQKLLKEGKTLPKDVFSYTYQTGETSTTDFYTVYEADLSEAEIAEYLTYKKLSLLRTIKNCAVFFTILAVIGIAAYFLFVLSM